MAMDAASEAGCSRQRGGSAVIWLLWTVLMTLPWLSPFHRQPWTSFHTDAAMGLAALPLMVWALVTSRCRFRVPLESLAMALLAAVPVAQRAAGLIHFGGDAWLAALYVFAFAVAVAVGAHWRFTQARALPNALFASFGIAATLSSGLALYQWLQLDGLGVLAFAIQDGGRITANLGQPNQLATLLVWGLLAFWWAYLHGHVHGTVAATLSALLLFGIAMTQSRAGALEVALLACGAVVFRQPLGSRQYRGLLVALGVWFAVAFLGWTPLNEALQLSAVSTLEQRLVPGTRWLHWQLLLDAIAQRPWAGWGWNQVVLAQVATALEHPPSHEVIQYSHNLLLDLLVWNGIPIGVLAILAVGAWSFWQVRLARSAERVLLMLAVFAFLLHALVELPHGYALFLLPVGLMVGALHVAPNGKRQLVLPRGVIALAFAVLTACVVLVIREYLEVDQAWMAHRFRSAHLGNEPIRPVPDLRVLTNLKALLEFVRIEPRRHMAGAQIEALRLTAERLPSAGGLYRYAQALALNGDTAKAEQTLRLLCRLHPEPQCTAARQAWTAAAANGMPEMKAAWPTAE